MIIIDKTICKRIARCRQECNLTQGELAANVGLNLSRLIKIEAGSLIPRISELAQLAVGFNISIDELVNNE
ncbi:MAG: helix-turn-helix transcriptional regulator [Desulfosporosinus sp.]|nr:helix-turn-helix transcriptional regulator [Desulfosporosinus sp.]